MPLQEIFLKTLPKDLLDVKKPASFLISVKSRYSALVLKGQSLCGEN